MDMNVLTYHRSRYNFLDLLANFGGFMGIFRWIFTIFMKAWNTSALDNFLASKLYKYKSDQPNQASDKDGKDEP